MRSVLALAALACAARMVFSSSAQAQLAVTLKAPWDGRLMPPGQQCRLFGGIGATPPLQVSGIPAGTAWIVVEFNDRNFAPLSSRGGHGIIAFPAKGTSMALPTVPGLTARLPGGAVVVAAAQTSGEYASAGYPPPCSGGRGHRYVADVKALDRANKVLATARAEVGRNRSGTVGFQVVNADCNP